MLSNHKKRSIILAFLGILACLLMMPPIAVHAAVPDDNAPPAALYGQKGSAAYHQYHCKKGPPGGLSYSGFLPKQSEGVIARP